MNDDQLKPARRTPIIIWCVRLGFCATIWFIGKYWLISVSLGTVSGQMILGGFVALSSLALIASFIRSKFSFILLIFSIIAIPFAFFLPMDAMLKGAWWEWLLVVPAQMGIPFAVAFYMWKAPKVRQYYSFESSATP
jgi:hypothetical protein